VVNEVNVGCHNSVVNTAQLLSREQIADAVDILRAGGLIGFPTETVYGLAADAENAEAVGRIFVVKGRPANHPLIVHLGSAEDLSEWAVSIPEYAHKLAAAFWPGPMTLVLQRSDRVQDFVTGGQPTVGIRVPSNPTAQAVLRIFGGGLAAPSANRFGELSPTTAAHVLRGLGEFLDSKRDAVLDGGASDVGLESTIIDCTSLQPRILRPGSVTAAQIADVSQLEVADSDGSIIAPGSLAAHYAPNARVHVVRDVNKLNQEISGAGFFALAEIADPTTSVRLGSPVDAAAFARDLYAALHKADELSLKDVYIVVPEGSGVELAILDRVSKAATGSGGSK
jgi:L-threonylcarbamoyladenylate synthase